MSVLNGILNGVFDVLLYPFRSMPPLVGLCIISVLLGILLLLLYKYTSPQTKIKTIKNNIKAGLYEVRLYKDDLGIVFKANKSLLLGNLAYFGCATVALVPLLIVVLPMIIQLDHRYGISPLEVGDKPYLKVVLSENADYDQAVNDLELDLPAGVEVDVGPVRIAEKKEFFYRLVVNQEVQDMLTVKVNGQTYEKRIDAKPGLSMVSPARYRSSLFLENLESPGEAAWPSNALLDAVEIVHSGRKDMAGIPGDYWPWLIVFCIVGLVAGIACKGVFNVTF